MRVAERIALAVDCKRSGLDGLRMVMRRGRHYHHGADQDIPFAKQAEPLLAQPRPGRVRREPVPIAHDGTPCTLGAEAIIVLRQSLSATSHLPIKSCWRDRASE